MGVRNKKRMTYGHSYPYEGQNGTHHHREQYDFDSSLHNIQNDAKPLFIVPSKHF